MRAELLTAISLWALAVTATGTARAGEPSPETYPRLPPVAREAFAAGLARFEAREGPPTGLGPTFNDESCAACHGQPVVGGSSDRVVTRFGRMRPEGFDPMTELGGPVIQSRSIVGEDCAASGETVPAAATIVARRDTPPLFGLGLVETIPDDRILRLADPFDADGNGIRGHPNVVRGRIGRFGWKAQIVTLREFVAAAYLNELGVTSPDFPDELAPQGGRVTCDAVFDPEDDGTRIDAVARFLLLLAPLPQARPKALIAGRRIFRRIGCEACHTTRLRAGPTHPARAVRGRRIPLFSDLLLHDLGPELGDGIAQGFASGSEFRTTPLWGIRASAPYLHDGSVATLEEAIVRHGGEAASARDRFMALPRGARGALITFLKGI
jgi:CxxC motif-containing protein (DUF1111 family)